MDTWALGVTSHLFLIVAIGAYPVFLICGTKFSSRICYQNKEQISMRGTNMLDLISFKPYIAWYSIVLSNQD